MKIQDRLKGMQSLFLDTAPVIYYIEKNPQFFQLVEVIFDAVDRGNIKAVTSPITLSESLIFPFKQSNTLLAQTFSDLIVHANNTQFININQHIGTLAAQLRVQYNLALMDAIQIATAIQSNCDGFLTNDVQLKRVSHIDIVVLQDYSV